MIRWSVAVIGCLLCLLVLAGPGRAQQSIVIPTGTPNEQVQAAIARGELTAFDLAKGGLQVGIAGRYPEGFAPGWEIASGNGMVLPVRHTDNRQTQPMVGRATMRVLIADYNGKPVLVFEQNGVKCMGDIVGVPTVIGASGQTFKLTNFRFLTAGAAKCKGDLLSVNYTGELTLAADTAGNLTISVTIQPLGWLGLPSQEFRAESVSVPNTMTIAQANLQLAARSNPPAAPVARAAPGAPASPSAARAPAAPSGPSWGLVDPDLSRAGDSLARVRTLQARLEQIDDIGFVGIVDPRTNVAAPIAYAEWNATRGGGFASADVTSRLKVGDNLIVFFIHNKAFAFGAGKWTFGFAFDGDGTTLISGSSGAYGGNVGIRYWTAFNARKSPSGEIDFRRASVQETARLLPYMSAVNRVMVERYGTEQSSIALVTGVMMASMFDMGSTGVYNSGCDARCWQDRQTEWLIDRANRDSAREQAERDRQGGN